MSAIGTVLSGRYEIISELGRGGTSTVYLAKDKNLGSYWAVKQVDGDLNKDMDSFKKEVELLSTLQHSDIPRIVDRVEIGKDYFVVMDFVDGTSLGKKVEAEGPQPEEKVVEWAKMLCDVLDYLHNVKGANPIVYRDMKPDNVMLMQSGRVKLIDFGIAKECERGKKVLGPPVGTRGYASPEQYKNSSNILDERSDIYSLGCTLYYVVSGVTPGKPPNGVRPLRQINPLISEGMEYIVSKCTSFKPEDRYQNCRELKYDLENIKKFNSSYKKKMVKRILLCAGSLVASFVFLILSVVGHKGMEAQKEDNYQTAYQTAYDYDRVGDYVNAIKYYREAIGYKDNDYEIYLSLFNALLPHTTDNDADRENLIKTAIDDMRKSYLDNEKSSMYHNSMLMYQVVVKGMDIVYDPVYAKYLLEYIKLIQQSKEYNDNTIDKIRVDSYYVIASNCADDLTTKNFKEFGSALEQLTNSTDNYNMEPEEKISNYFTILRIYCTYATKIDSAYDKIIEISNKAQDLIVDSEVTIIDGSSGDTDGIEISELVSIYKTLANRLYSGAKSTTNTDVQKILYENSLKWFELLDAYDNDLGTDLNLIKGNCYKGFYDTYSNKKTDEAKKCLQAAINIYKSVLNEDSSNFSAKVYYTQALLAQENISHNADRKKEIDTLYNQLKSQSSNVGYTEKTLFNALKEEMKIAGLEV